MRVEVEAQIRTQREGRNLWFCILNFDLFFFLVPKKRGKVAVSVNFFKDKTSEGFQSGAATVIKEKLVYDSATTEFRKRKKEGFTPAVTIECSDGFIPKAATVAKGKFSCK